PPQSLESEKSILFTAISEKRVLDEIMERLSPDDFYSSYHKQIYIELQAMHKGNIPVDEIILCGRLEKADDIQLINSFYDLQGCIIAASNVAYHINVLQENRKLRDLIEIACQVQAEAFTGNFTGSELIDKTSVELFSLSDNNSLREAEMPAQTMSKTFESMERRAKGEICGIQTGFKCLDDYLGGLGLDDLIIIAGRPGSGKTALALNIAKNVSGRGTPVALFELEMNKDQVNQRLLSLESEISTLSMRVGKTLTKVEFSKLCYASGKVAYLPLLVDDNPVLTIPQLLSKSRRYIRKHGIKLIIVDYLGLMKSECNQPNRVQEISEITRGLKLVAKTLQVPVIALSQLSRQNEQRKDHKPLLSDLRDSGSIEQDADVVLFVHREEMYSSAPEHRGKANIIIGKQRSGPTGLLEVLYKDYCCKFEEVSEGAF
ncbi:MAG TPA: replicative DNA helicase, partial [Chitinispirillaceae bacterium]|nr:replicative DNA helicase [Chitinispirillaceae bacterium]